MTAAAPVLFSENGASWAWLLAGPAAAGAMLLIQLSTGYGFSPWVPLLFLAVVSGFLAVQVKASRIHAGVILTPESLREGAETVRIDEIVLVYPPAGAGETPKWKTARALGELAGLPKGRTGIGLKLTGGRTAQAWARRHAELRAALTALVQEQAV